MIDKSVQSCLDLSSNEGSGKLTIIIVVVVGQVVAEQQESNVCIGEHRSELCRFVNSKTLSAGLELEVSTV